MNWKTLLITALAGFMLNYSHAGNVTAVQFDESTQSVSFNGDIDTKHLGTFSAQIVYSTSPIVTQSLTSGIRPFINFTVDDWESVQGRSSTMTFTIPFGQNSDSILDGAVLTVNGKRFVEGIHFFTGQLSSHTMESLAAAVTTYYPTSLYKMTFSSNVVTVTANSTGTFANSWFATTSTGAAILVGTSTSSGWQAPFAYGNDFGYFSINGITKTEGTDFFAITSAINTAKAISDVIEGNSSFDGIAVATSASNIVFASSTYHSVDPLLFSGGPGLVLTVISAISQAVNISTVTDTISILGHGFGDGQAVFITTQIPNITPTGLRDRVTYYAIITNENEFKLASDQVNAIAGTAINITDLPINNSSVTITALTYIVNKGISGFRWQASNDGENWSDLSVSSITSQSILGSGSVLWDFDDPAYRFYRGAYKPPIFGANNIKAISYGQEK